MDADVRLLAGAANPSLARAIAAELNMSLSSCVIERFPDGEVSILLRESVRHATVCIIQPTGPPVNEHLVELLALVDACRRDGARRVIALVPYFGYARADKRAGRRVPVTASMIATLLQTVGVDQVITVDLHADQIEGFFHVPVDNLSAIETLAGALRKSLDPATLVVSPDAGRVRMATAYAQQLDTALVVLHKQRVSGAETHVTHVVGDVRERPCLIVDDMIVTGGTLADGAAALRRAGARDPIIVAATHGVLLPGARERLAAGGIARVVVTDTLPIQAGGQPALEVVSLAPLLAESIRRCVASDSWPGQR